MHRTRWVFYAGLALGAVLDVAAQGFAAEATFTGQITFRGAIPLERVPNDQGIRAPLLKVHAKSGGLANTVVWLEPLDGQRSPPFDPGRAEPVVIDQKNMLFEPHVTAVRGGQRIRFTNSDPANHNIRAQSIDSRNTFNVFTGTGGSYEHRFESASRLRPVALGCDIHGWMRAWVLVFDHGYFAVTDSRGRYRIDQVPPGRYRWQAQQPDGRLTARVEIVVDDKDTSPQRDHEFTAVDLPND